MPPHILNKLKKNFHVFLDNLSGDIFGYNAKKMQWEPLANVGLHHRRAKASIQGGRENMITEDKVTRMQRKS